MNNYRVEISSSLYEFLEKVKTKATCFSLVQEAEKYYFDLNIPENLVKEPEFTVWLNGQIESFYTVFNAERL